MADTVRKIQLPRFLIKGLKVNCYLGKNDAIPEGDNQPLTYKLMLSRFSEVYDNLRDNYGDLDRNDTEYLKKHLATLFRQVRDLEKPIRNQLEKICAETVIKLFGFPEAAAEFKCEIVDSVQTGSDIGIDPMSNDFINYEFDDTDSMEQLQKEVIKRRVIDSLIQGASYMFSECYGLYIDRIYEMNKRLPSMYDELRAINDYLLFTEDVAITEDDKRQGAFVEVRIGGEGKRTQIHAQGLTFPFLLTETIRGALELFASHGLPMDSRQANYVLRQADFLKAEPWDLRTGVGLWRLVSDNCNVTDREMPYFFSDLCAMSVSEFNSAVKNMVAKTRRGKAIFGELKDEAVRQKKLNQFRTDVIAKHKGAMITDGYYSGDDLDSLLNDEEDF